MSELRKYTYDGPVMMFERVVDYKWHGETMAPTKEKAMSNLKYQYKMQTHQVASSRVDLPGKVKLVP